jgi:adenine-specific DNA-methyltransferase
MKKYKEKFPKVNFIGNKDKIAEWICDYFPSGSSSVFDAFSGGGSVGYEAKRRGLRVVSNDVLRINYLLAKSLIENKNEKLSADDVELIFTGKPVKGFMYHNYSNVLFFPDECRELDLYRKNIEKLPSDNKKAVALSLMRRAMIRKMPYSRFNLPWEKIKQLRDEEYSYKKYKRKRAYHNDSFQNHFLASLDEFQGAIFDNGRNNNAYNRDIFDLLGGVEADIIYLDPPYSSTMNNYFGFYGPLDEYVSSRREEPFKNNFIDRNASLILFDKLFSGLKDYKYWVLSYNNSSYPSKEEIIGLIKKYSRDVKLVKRNHTYRVTGKRNKRNNIEYLFIAKKNG